MAYGRRDTSVYDSFTLSPLPYHLLLVLILVLLLLSVSWFFTYEEIVEEAGDHINWLLLFSPVLLLIIIRWISSVDSFDGLLAWAGWLYPYDQRYNQLSYGSSEGGSPWGVAAVVVVVLVMVFFRSF